MTGAGAGPGGPRGERVAAAPRPAPRPRGPRVGWDDKQPVFRPIRHAWRVEVAHGRLGPRRLASLREHTISRRWLHVPAPTTCATCPKKPRQCRGLPVSDPVGNAQISLLSCSFSGWLYRCATPQAICSWPSTKASPENRGAFLTTRWLDPRAEASTIGQRRGRQPGLSDLPGRFLHLWITWPRYEWGWRHYDIELDTHIPVARRCHVCCTPMADHPSRYTRCHSRHAYEGWPSLSGAPPLMRSGMPERSKCPCS